MYTLGGKYPGQLPPKIRLVALGHILIFLLFGAVVLARSGSALSAIYPFSHVAIWFVAGFFMYVRLHCQPDHAEQSRMTAMGRFITLLVTILIALGL